MSYQETVRSKRPYMGWNFILDIELEYADSDKSNNPWRGNHPRTSFKISLGMPVDDWLFQKLERLNLSVAAEQSTAQDAGGLTDQFIKTLKPQDKWYPMHKQKPHNPLQLGRKLSRWHASESKI